MAQELERQRSATDAQSANLLVTPHQAEILSQAIAQNRIQLVLRNPLDNSNIAEAVEPPKPAPPVRKVREVPPPEKKVEVAAAPPPPPLPTIEIVHGSKRTVTVVSATAPASIPSQGASQGTSQEVTR